jgi:dienelactone hydrolase
MIGGIVSRMNLPRCVIVIIVACQLFVGIQPIHASPVPGSDFPSAPLSESVLFLPGDPKRRVSLEVTVMKPDGKGPFPLAVMNHGAADPGQSPSSTARYRASFQAFYFLSRGYAVVLPMQRGFANSGGRLESYQCDVARFGLENAKDIIAVMQAVATDSDIDTERAIVAGQSFGAWNTLALGAESPSTVRGLMIFNGGVRASDCKEQDRALLTGIERFGQATKIPSLWFYAENDALFPPPLWLAMHERYTKAGGRAQLVDVGVVGENGHEFSALGTSLKLWMPAADAFLARIGLPNTEVYPQYLPGPPPPPSHYAAIDDLAALPFPDEALKAEYRKFLGNPLPRAFVIGSTNASMQSGGFDPLATAFRSCRAASTNCAAYAVDNDVVWTGPPRRATVVRETVPSGRPSRVLFVPALNSNCSERGIVGLEITQPPSHGTAIVEVRRDMPKFPSSDPLAACNTTLVTGQVVVYTPSAGYTGPETLTLTVTTLDQRQRVLYMNLTVN